jgi:hypothetical protein
VPVQNNLNEYYTMINWVQPDLLGTPAVFNHEFTTPIDTGLCSIYFLVSPVVSYVGNALTSQEHAIWFLCSLCSPVIHVRCSGVSMDCLAMRNSYACRVMSGETTNATKSA